MKSPEMPSQEGKNDNPISHMESNSRADQLKKDLKFSFWDFQTKNGTNASVADFANDPSFAKCLNDAKQSGLSMDEMAIAVDFIRDTYGKKAVSHKNDMKVPAQDIIDDKQIPGKVTETINTNQVQDSLDRFTDRLASIGRESDKRYEAAKLTDEQQLTQIKANLARIATEANARDEEERKRIENEEVVTRRTLAETQKQRDETRERERLDREVDLLSNTERKKKIESFVKNVENELPLLARKFFVKMRQDQYDKANLPLDQVERHANYMNDVYSEVRNFVPDGNDLQFSIRDNNLVCVAGRSIEGVHLASFDLMDFDNSSREQVLLDVNNRWKTFVSLSRKAMLVT